AAVEAFPEKIYHGAALSAVDDGSGGMHLVYKDNSGILHYRHFDGSSFGLDQIVEDQGGWELQPAITRVGADLWIFYNRVIDTSTWDEIRVRELSGELLGEPTVLDSSQSFKGYPAGVDVRDPGTATLPYFISITPNSESSGVLALYSVTIGSGPPPVDAGV